MLPKNWIFQAKNYEEQMDKMKMNIKRNPNVKRQVAFNLCMNGMRKISKLEVETMQLSMKEN